MVVRAQVTGQRELKALARDLKAFGDKDVRKGFYRSLQQAAKPMVEQAQKEAARLPHRGGLSKYVAANLRGRTSSSAARVRVVFSAPQQAAAAFKAQRRRAVRRSRARHREKLMTPEQKAARAEKRRAAAARAAATRRARKG